MYEKVLDLYEQGYTRRQLAEKTALSRNTIRHYLQAGQFPEITRSREKRSKLNRIIPTSPNATSKEYPTPRCYG